MPVDVGKNQVFIGVRAGSDEAAIRRGYTGEAGKSEAFVAAGVIDIGDKYLVFERAYLNHVRGDEFSGWARGKRRRHEDHLCSRLRQAADILRKFHIVADQHAQFQPGKRDNAAGRFCRGKQGPLIIAKEMRFPVNGRLGIAADKGCTVVDVIAIPFGKTRDNGYGVGLGYGLQPIDLSAIGRLCQCRDSLSRTVTGQGEFRGDQQVGTGFGGSFCGLLDACQISADIAASRLHLECCDPHHLSSEGHPVRSTFPKEGGIQDSGCWAVSRASKKIDEAHIFINYMSQPAIQATLSRKVGTAPTVKRELLDLNEKEFAAVSSDIEPILPRYDLLTTKADFLNQKWTELIVG